jgi:hypothetical protein
MTSWTDVDLAEPEFATAVRDRFLVRKHATMATISRDGSPRISGTEVDFAEDGEIYLGMMAGARRAADLRRDGRVAIHCPTEDPPPDNPNGWPGEAKISAYATELVDPLSGTRSHRFRLDIRRVVLTTIASTGDELEITVWGPGRALEVIRRR